MTFTIDIGILQGIGQLLSLKALGGLFTLGLILMLCFKLAVWGDATNNRGGAKANYFWVVVAIVIVIAIVSVAFTGQPTGHTTLITAPGQARMWG